MNQPEAWVYPSRWQAHLNKRCGGTACFYCEHPTARSAIRWVKQFPAGYMNRHECRRLRAMK
jgi:hypothetical protein